MAAPATPRPTRLWACRRNSPAILSALLVPQSARDVLIRTLDPYPPYPYRVHLHVAVAVEVEVDDHIADQVNEYDRAKAARFRLSLLG